MKKIGILTYWGVPNYGAWTQAYAMQKIVEKICPYDDVMQIQYLNDVHWKSYYQNDLKLYNNFSYSWNNIPHTRRLYENALEKENFDIIITGSDSIWEYSVPQMGNDKHLIGNNLKAKKIIAYAASSGITQLEKLKQPWITEGLKRYDKIFVRDQFTKNSVEELINKDDISIVLDPALLWDFNSDNNIKSPQIDDYIVVYGRSFEKDFICSVLKLKEQTGYKLVSIGYINDWCDYSFKKNELRCEEWIGMFKNAKCVVTSTFHGLMLGLSFKKEIKFNQVEYVKNRSNTLVELLDITLKKDVFEKELDYSRIEIELKKLRDSSISMLKGAILNDE